MKKRMTIRMTAAFLTLLLLLPMTLAGCGKSGEKQVETSQMIEDKTPDDGKFYLVLPDLTAKPGETVKVKCYLAGNPGIGGFSFCLNYDKSIFAASDGKVTIDDNAFSACGSKDEGANFIWTSLTPYTGDGEFCEINLKVAGDAAPGSYPLKVVFRDGEDSFYKIEDFTADIPSDGTSGVIDDMPDIPITVIDGSIVIEAAE